MIDPDRNLARQLELAARIQGAERLSAVRAHAAVELAKLVTELADWLGQGGQLPTAWLLHQK